MPTTPVKSVRDQIANRLRSELLSGQHPPGTPLREECLAERFGVSRMPIRHVLQQLADEGLLLAKRNCGVTVAPPPPDAVRGLLMPIRVQIETFALRACFAGSLEPLLREWQRLIGPFKLACAEADRPAVFERDMDFHRALLVEANLADLLPLWTQIINKTTAFYEHDDLPAEDLPIIYEVHVALLDTIRASDVDIAVTALTQHILNGEFNQEIHRRWQQAKNRRLK
jgi:DNA-binding GntR family transcriptional regulator